MTKDEALKLALDWFCCYLDKSMSRNNQETLTEETITAIKEALAQPEQEPVAWMVWGENNVPSLTFTKPSDKYVFDSLYMAPPQRTWVGLTLEELSEIYNRTEWDTVTGWEYERAIEAKLKAKNGFHSTEKNT